MFDNGVPPSSWYDPPEPKSSGVRCASCDDHIVVGAEAVYDTDGNYHHSSCWDDKIIFRGIMESDGDIY